MGSHACRFCKPVQAKVRFKEQPQLCKTLKAAQPGRPRLSTLIPELMSAEGVACVSQKL